jgi:hypothetical protein
MRIFFNRRLCASSDCSGLMILKNEGQMSRFISGLPKTKRRNWGIRWKVENEEMEKNAVKICQPKEGHGVFGWAWDSTFACEKRRMGSARGYGWLVLWTSHLGAPLVHLQTSQYYLDGRCSSTTQDHAYSISTPFFFFLKRQFPNKWQTVKHGQPLQKLHATASRQLVSSVNSSTSLGVCYLRLQYTRSSEDTQLRRWKYHDWLKKLHENKWRNVPLKVLIVHWL